MATAIRFEDFSLDPADRQLRRGGEPVELSSRYFDALALLVAERGRLVTKDRFMGEVWRGVPVTDEALTQCIKTLRRQLGDDAARPRFIETVPKHGYRFIAELDGVQAAAPTADSAARREWFLLAGAGVFGSVIAGAVGGLFYGFGGAPGMGAMSVLVVLLALTILVALVGGAGVSAGVAAAQAWRRDDWWASAGLAALGGLLVGAIVKLLGIDAFNLLFGRAPSGMTGGLEGALLGGAAGLAAWLALRPERLRHLRRSVAIAAGLGAAAGSAITLLGGQMLGGSLDLLSKEFDQSRIDLSRIGGLFGETGFGRVSHLVTGALEGGLFAAFLVGAMVVARRRRDGSAS